MGYTRIHMTDTPCAKCPHFSRIMPPTSIGVCRHKEGPTSKVFGNVWSMDAGYPKGCPIDPSPPAPPRRRPGKKRLPRLPLTEELPMKEPNRPRGVY
jgi:hypothetical protein